LRAVTHLTDARNVVLVFANCVSHHSRPAVSPHRGNSIPHQFASVTGFEPLRLQISRFNALGRSLPRSAMIHATAMLLDCVAVSFPSRDDSNDVAAFR